MDFKDFFSTQDSCLDGLSYQELIDTVLTNEPHHDMIRLEKVFDELIKLRVQAAKENFKFHKVKLIKELESQSPQYLV